MEACLSRDMIVPKLLVKQHLFLLLIIHIHMYIYIFILIYIYRALEGT